MSAAVRIFASIIALTAMVGFGGCAGTAIAADDRHICQAESGDVAIAACNRAINSGKFSGKSLAIVYINRGAEWKAKQEDDKALADYTTAIKLDPSIPAIYNNRANIYRKRGGVDRAIADYSTAIRLDPLYTELCRNLGDEAIRRRGLTTLQ